MHKFKRYSWNDKAFYIITILILTIFFIMVLYPCIFVVSASFSSGTAVRLEKLYCSQLISAWRDIRLFSIPRLCGSVLQTHCFIHLSELLLM